MQVVLVPAAAYLALYAPGHYLLRARGCDDPGTGSHLFREILLSACCTSWLGFVLAEIGLFSVPALLGCLALTAAIAAVLTRGSGRPAYGALDVAGVAMVCLTWLWVAPPLDTRILGSDSAGYLASGVQLSRHGTLIIHDPTLPLLSPDLKRALFRSATRNPGSPPYLRLAGALLLRSLDSDEVLPAFHHLIAVWVALFHGLAGSRAAAWVITLFAGLSVWAMIEFARAWRGALVALAFFTLVSLSPVQNWYSRFLMPEIPAQFFVWGGLCCLYFWSRTHTRIDAVLAGLAFGIAGLMRIENIAFLLVALPAGLWLRRKALHSGAWIVLGCAALVWAHAVAHLIAFRTHYAGNLLSFFSDTFAIFTQASPAMIALLLSACAAAVVVSARRTPIWRSVDPLFVIVVAAGCIALWGDWQRGWPGLGLLKSYMGVPVLVAGGAGIAFSARREDGRNAAISVFSFLAVAAFVQVILAPHATPVPIWVVRRAATIVAPAFCLGAALLCGDVLRRPSYVGALLLFAAAVAGESIPFARLWQAQYYRGGLRHIRAVSALLPSGACLIFDRQLVGWGFDVGLWSERDLPAYFLSASNAPDLAKLVRSFEQMPVYWIGNGSTPPPRHATIAVTSIGLYEFIMATPPSDLGAAAPEPTYWDSTIAVYRLRAAPE